MTSLSLPTQRMLKPQSHSSLLRPGKDSYYQYSPQVEHYGEMTKGTKVHNRLVNRSTLSMHVTRSTTAGFSL